MTPLILLRVLKGARVLFAAHWQWLVPLLLALALTWYVDHLRAARDQARDDLAALQQQIATAAGARREENARKDAAARHVLAAVDADHQATIQQLMERYETQRKNDQASAARTVDQWRERLRLEVARHVAGMPGLPGAAAGPAEGGGDSDSAAAGSAVATLETACAITTADYNALHQAWDYACLVYGCEVK